MSLPINGKAYDWSDVTVDLPGLEIQVQEVTYSDELEKELVYGRGNRPRGYGTGNYKSDAKITLLQEDFNDLKAYCKKKRKKLYKLVIPKILVSYADDDSPTVTDELNTVTITKTSNKVAQGDKSIKVELDLMVVHGIKRDGLEPI